MEAILKHPDERSYYSEMDLCVLRKEGSYKTGQNFCFLTCSNTMETFSTVSFMKITIINYTLNNELHMKCEYKI